MIPAAIYENELASIAATVSEPLKLELIRLTLASAVEIELAHLRRTGGPTEYAMDAAHEFIAHQRLGEAILYATKNETREQMRVLCEITAILAFCPGGVTLFGLHFEAKCEVSK